MRYPLMLILYGILFVSLIPFLIGLTTSLFARLKDHLTGLGSSIASLVFLGSIVLAALYLWLRIARHLIKRACEEGPLRDASQ